MVYFPFSHLIFKKAVLGSNNLVFFINFGYLEESEQSKDDCDLAAETKARVLQRTAGIGVFSDRNDKLIIPALLALLSLSADFTNGAHHEGRKHKVTACLQILDLHLGQLNFKLDLVGHHLFPVILAVSGDVVL